MHSHENIDASQRRKNVVDKNTLELVQCVLENCRCICKQMGYCGKGYDLCRARKDLDITSPVTFSQTCDASTMKSRLEQSVRLVELGQWVAELIHDIKHPAAAINTAVQTLQRLPNLEHTAIRAVVWVDADQIKEVFMNIVVNAIEAMLEDGILSISTKAYQDTIQIVFTDTGFGIPAEDLDLIFNPFHSTKMGGIGLGLTIARRIVEAHNGYIEVTSQVERGSTFSVTLPRLAD